ncbi:MAG: hypothetical protein J5859_01395, partial [Clostridia bacterium]|nr:hypothetical protein [Clostridia bacterium]
MKKILSLIIIFALLLSIPAMSAAAEENGLWIGDYTLTYWIPIDYSSAQVYDSYADHPFFKWMEEKTGVKITFIHPSEEQMDQQFNLMVSSGKYYDMMFNAGSDMVNREEMLNAGVWADIYEFEDIMPNYFKCIRCSDGSCYAWEWGPEKAFIGTAPQPEWETGCVTDSGRLWCVTQTNCDEWPTEAGALIRQDWLDEFGLDVPQTIDELEKVLEAFRSKGDDIIPMTLAQDGCNCTTGYLCSAFDIRPCWMTQDDGLIRQVGWAREEG